MTGKNIDWKNLGFGYIKTDFNIQAVYKDGEWGKLELRDSDKIELNIAATGMHYGQQVFEGLKAFRGEDGKVRIFRMDQNAKRLALSAEGIMMESVPEELFCEAIEKVVAANAEFVPPYGSGASLYIRPLLIGSGAQIGVKPSDEYTFVVFVMPVGPYFKEGFTPTDLAIYREFDRAAPLGTGQWKVGGNYAASLAAGDKAHENGFSAVLYLDAKEKRYIDECGPANFFAIAGDRYITPKSSSILPSITNDSLRQIATDLGLEVECRKIEVEELAGFDEVGACGTAAVISPIKRIYDADNDVEYCYGDGEPGKISVKLYEKLRNIQDGTEDDPYGWVTVLDL